MTEKTWIITDKTILNDLLKIEEINIISNRIRARFPKLGAMCKIEVSGSGTNFYFENAPNEAKPYFAAAWLTCDKVTKELINIAENIKR